MPGGPLRIPLTSETKRCKLRFAEKTCRRARANFKKIHGLVAFYSLPAFGRPLALLSACSCIFTTENVNHSDDEHKRPDGPNHASTRKSGNSLSGKVRPAPIGG